MNKLQMNTPAVLVSQQQGDSFLTGNDCAVDCYSRICFNRLQVNRSKQTQMIPMIKELPLKEKALLIIVFQLIFFLIIIWLESFSLSFILILHSTFLLIALAMQPF